ncbi:LysM peptidoglycan-binding domain-containing protein [Halomonas chromatireducens]|uniref:LysM domain/BON superfamily protein n=1 Tax=Halomonas chromatireducens TaxID=507626 RepID=A0A0X8HDA8_9GAMM|nr:LysM peptidoglycan-binding domain-containing protein [Halomonas chromatireducens]AMD00522.1 LysM domain/BON superfamily protein [Halomonas chromatireducens]
MNDLFLTSTGPKQLGTVTRLVSAGLLVFALSGTAIAQQDEEAGDAEAAQQTDETTVESTDAPVEENEVTEDADDETNDEQATDAQADELTARLEERGAQLRQAQRELTALRARLPQEEGGDLDLDSAVNSARLTAEAIRSARSELLQAGGSDAALEENIDQLIAELARDQALVARGRGDTLYEVRRGETLAGIAGRYYGNSNRWEAIHEANAHVLRNPDLVWPGLTLVLPR